MIEPTGQTFTGRFPRLICMATLLLSILLSSCSRLSKKNNRPNILLCVLDDVTYHHLGAYGCTWVKTPTIDSLSRLGILFTRAYTPNAKSAPSRAALLTGRNPWQLEAAANHWCYFPWRYTSFMEAILSCGYVTGYTGKGWAPGVANNPEGNPRQMTGKAYNDLTLDSPGDNISNLDYAANFAAFLHDNTEGKPFCFWFGALEPHRGFTYASGIGKGGKKLSDIDHIYGFWPETDSIRTDLLDYAYEIEHVDKQLSLIVSHLKQSGLFNNTLIIITSDNGMPFPRVKGQNYALSNHVPFIACWPNGIRHGGRVVDDFVSLIDVAPTVLELTEICSPATEMKPVTGKSLVPLFLSHHSGRIDPARNYVLTGREVNDVGRPGDDGYPVRGLMRDGFLYLRNFKPNRWPSGNPETGYLDCDGSPTKTGVINLRRDSISPHYWQLCFGLRAEEEFYQVETDEECLVNLVNDTVHHYMLQVFRTQLHNMLIAQGDPRMTGSGEIFDTYPYADTSVVGFYERYMAGERPVAGWVNPEDFDAETGD